MNPTTTFSCLSVNEVLIRLLTATAATAEPAAGGRAWDLGAGLALVAKDSAQETAAAAAGSLKGGAANAADVTSGLQQLTAMTAASRTMIL